MKLIPKRWRREPCCHRCYVCGRLITCGEEHAYHEQGCPARDPAPHAPSILSECAEFGACGEDVHPACCPTCRGVT